MGQFLSNLASLFHHRGEFAKAMPLFRRALLILDTSIGRDHPASNHVRSKLARLLWDSGFPRQAYTVGNAALVAHAKALGKKHDWTIASARITATALETLGRAKEARALRKRYGIRKIK
jgi:hypothetical protein